MGKFAPVSRQDMQALGWSQADFIFVSGDAYIDHPAFGTALLCRLLEAHGYRVGVIAQPDWHSVADFKRLGRPRLGFLVSAGNMDSMVCHYTAAKKRRSNDAYSPEGAAGLRPDRASIVYCNRIRQAYGSVPIIIGGIEASLRRFAHYDYWDDDVRRSILCDSGADLLVYGMGERQLLWIAAALNNGMRIGDLTHIEGTCYMSASLEKTGEFEYLAAFGDVARNKKKYAKAFAKQYLNQDALLGKRLVQLQDRRYLVQNPPALPLTQQELDEVYALPFSRQTHPQHGYVPAIEEVQFSLVSSRGCFGGCSFCALSFHQGRVVQGRSADSVVQEALKLTFMPDFKGNIHDVGGPTANFFRPACDRQRKGSACLNRRCLQPELCPSLQVSHGEYTELLRRLRRIPGVKNVFIRSGLRFDYIMADQDETFLKELVQHHVSGQLKIAPEHISSHVLGLMGKPGAHCYEAFARRYGQMNEQLGKKQFIVPYFMSSHPGSRLEDAIELAVFLKKNGLRIKQVQDFYPTPGTLSTCMYHTGYDPLTMQTVYVPKDYEEKRQQRALLQYYKKENHEQVHKALLIANRRDLIGTQPHHLIRPLPAANPAHKAAKANKAAQNKKGKKGLPARTRKKRGK
ncbi:MAG: YgiQ family radical SAM protein [Christensenellales bacterium]